MNNMKKIIFLTIIFLVGIGCDLLSKGLAARHLKFSPSIQLIPKILDLHYTENDAIAFSMLKTVPITTRKFIIYSSSLIAFVVLGVVTWQSRLETFGWLASLMLILSGAVGNFVDRIMNGYVVDFIYLHYADKFSWPIFNVADTAITIGAILLAILMLRKPAPENATDNLTTQDNEMTINI
jgi:signal peptidase II